MKNALPILLILFLLFGCVADTTSSDSPGAIAHTLNPSKSDTPDITKSIEYQAYYSRTYGFNKDVSGQTIKTIHSFNELDEYYSSFVPEDLEYDNLFEENVAPPFRFSDLTTTYNNEYFIDNVLILIQLREKSGSTRHQVEAVETNSEKTTVYINRLIPDIFTDDMADWHIILEAAAVDIADTVELELSEYKTQTSDLYIVSGSNMYTNLYNRTYSETKYIQGKGTLFADMEQFDPKDVLQTITEVDWSHNLEIVTQANCTARCFRVYDESLENYSEQTETLDMNMFDKPGKYPIRFIAFWTLGTKHGADSADTVSKEYFFLLVVNDEDIGKMQ